NRCIESVCNPLVSSCEHKVCDHVDGSCVNARRCMHSAECLSGYQCVGTTCVAEHEGCAVCPGNQRYEYQSASRTFVCLDADHCVNSHDCIRPRTCRGGRCVVQPTCTPDDYEPNNFTPMAAPYPSPDEEPEGVKAR